MTVELEALSGMDDLCYGKDHCEECIEYNAGGFCPCGEAGCAEDYDEYAEDE